MSDRRSMAKAARARGWRTRAESSPGAASWGGEEDLRKPPATSPRRPSGSGRRRATRTTAPRRRPRCRSARRPRRRRRSRRRFCGCCAWRSLVVGTPCIAPAEAAPAAAKTWRAAGELWRTRGAGTSGILALMAKTVAIVEDDAAIRANYADMLKKHGYQVSAFGDRKSATDAFRTRLPDLALLDIGLADEPDAGFALCRDLRAMSAALPIIFLTARDSDFDTVSGLRMGADDYVTKDVALPQLLARISALFRRAELLAQPPAAEEVLERGPLRLDMKRFQALWGEKVVDLTLTEFWLTHS